MAFESVQNYAALQAAAAERKRREEQAMLARDEADLAGDITEQKREAASGPAAVLADLMSGKRAAVAGDVLKNADEDRFLNEQATRRFERRANTFEARKRDLSIPGPTATERYAELTAPLGRFANEDPAAVQAELRTNPGGREAELEALKNRIVGGNVSRETSDRPIMVGTGSGGEPYFTNLSREELHQERRATDAIRDRSGMPDVGAPPRDFRRIHVGGTSLGSEPKDDAGRKAQLEGIEGLIRQVRGARSTPMELAADLVTATPEWDLRAATVGPAGIEAQINEAVASGQMRPETGQYLQRRYGGLQSEAYDEEGIFEPEKWANRLTTGRAPMPGEAENRARTGGQAVPQAAAQEQAALTNAATPPPGGPGATPSPALAAESSRSPDALLAGLRPQRQVQNVGGADLGYEIGGDFIPNTGREAIPPWAQGLPEDVRLLLQGASFAAGGRESGAERRRRLARERG